MELNSAEIRRRFLHFFETKGHVVVPSAPLVNKADPSLLFTNAGMNQFKDIFTGSKPVVHPRVVDTQKCLRVSGKHNDLDEVGYDTYHHTLFEMLGNWSFGDYFKQEAIAWAWEFITQVVQLNPERLYVTIFAGADGVPIDEEAARQWAKVLPADRILSFGKKENFWEMGDTGPCGPCSEIHVDVRPAEARAQQDARELVNKDHPQVIEIWNLVFIQFNRKADGSLEQLAMQSVDTGMGFERLCMVLQGKQSTYDTDVFAPLRQLLEHLAGVQYQGGAVTPARPGPLTDVAIRVCMDHVRAIAMAIADGQLPGNAGAGYVIRRILRRASRYGFQYLGLKQPFLHQLVPALADYFATVFPELAAQQSFVQQIIQQEEKNFLRTLEAGLKRLEDHFNQDATQQGKLISGQLAFQLFDTYGFPLDLTQLIARERGWQVAIEGADGFHHLMQQQKERSRTAGASQAGDWVVVAPDADTYFVGYDQLSISTEIIRYRTLTTPKGPQYQLQLLHTPFYAESGGQVGDTGTLQQGVEVLQVLATQKENDLIVHLVDKLPQEPGGTWLAHVDAARRHPTEANHSATHLLHAALRQVLGTHVEQRGSLVSPNLLRFDFSHFQKLTETEQYEVEAIVNEKIAAAIPLQVYKDVPLATAKQMGAMALFGEKYGEKVRVVRFQEGFSTELCGGTHVPNTLAIRYFKLLSESSVAAGVRRIEAVTGQGAFTWLTEQASRVAAISTLLGQPQQVEKAVADLVEKNKSLQHQLDQQRAVALQALREQLAGQVEQHGQLGLLVQQVEVTTAEELKQLSFELRKVLHNTAILLGALVHDKPLLSVIFTDNLKPEAGYDAVKLVREMAQLVDGGGGGQPYYATAGGKNTRGLSAALQAGRAYLLQLV